MGVQDVYQFQSIVCKSALNEGSSKTEIIVRRPYEHLANEIKGIFKNQEDVSIIIDRRYAERRGQNGIEIEKERRRADRRQPKEKLVDVIITVKSNSKRAQGVDHT